MAEARVRLRVVNVAVERITFEASISRAEVRERLRPGDSVQAVLVYENQEEEKKRVEEERKAEEKEAEEKKLKAAASPTATTTPAPAPAPAPAAKKPAEKAKETTAAEKK